MSVSTIAKREGYHWLGKLAFLTVMLDSFNTYVLREILGHNIPVNMLVPFIILLLLIARGIRYLMPDNRSTALLILTSFGFLISVATISDLGYPRIFETISAAIAFIVGYNYARWTKDEDEAAHTLLIVGVVYSAVCTIAVLRILPQYFPVIDKVWSLNGTLIKRPEVTTDQNFQIFYLIPAILLIALPFKKYLFIIAIATLLGSFLTLAKLQTRSGLLIAFGLTFIIIITPFWYKYMGRWKIYILPAAGIILMIIFFPIIMHLTDAIIIRFTQTDYSTGLGRLYSFLYLFDKIYNPLWWLPMGNSEFVKITGYLPHSNSTAVFLDGGIFAFFGWLLLVVIPIFKLGYRFIQSKLDNLSVILSIGVLGSFITQMSLNVPLMDQVWLWAGISNGLLVRDTYKRPAIITNTQISQNPGKKANNI